MERPVSDVIAVTRGSPRPPTALTPRPARMDRARGGPGDRSLGVARRSTSGVPIG